MIEPTALRLQPSHNCAAKEICTLSLPGPRVPLAKSTRTSATFSFPERSSWDDSASVSNPCFQSISFVSDSAGRVSGATIALCEMVAIRLDPTWCFRIKGCLAWGSVAVNMKQQQTVATWHIRFMHRHSTIQMFGHCFFKLKKKVSWSGFFISRLHWVWDVHIGLNGVRKEHQDKIS